MIEGLRYARNDLLRGKITADQLKHVKKAALDLIERLDLAVDLKSQASHRDGAFDRRTGGERERIRPRVSGTRGFGRDDARCTGGGLPACRLRCGLRIRDFVRTFQKTLSRLATGRERALRSGRPAGRRDAWNP
ncbi:hypothetical protein FAZ95_13050 [Trinickia violacea]|uniref:Uncharacterized protein n=1 Tax=Trinickia violacea TaxID=2571746 RepID=A0A4P8IPW7_9BURK|nr:hypothetical protein [Trinickia violacea]QCP50027.1 hypothetical protein FAZ95_13050 [Trinickia violacea]